jgi:uncharacterized membrane protein
MLRPRAIASPLVPGQPAQFDREEREVEFSRALAFSDGVFAFAITLLVTTLDVPDLSGPDINAQLIDQVEELGPRFGSFFLSFAVIGLLWLRHHRLLSRVRQLDTGALVLNLVLLAFIVLMPFSTEMFGRYGDTWFAVSVYALNIAIEALAFTALWWYCVTRDMLGEDLTPRQVRYELLLRAVVPACFLVSIPLALLASTEVAHITWVASIPAQMLLARILVDEGEVPRTDALD